MTDQFANVRITREMPAEDYEDAALDVTYARVPRGIYVGGDGNIQSTNQSGDTITFVGLKGGVVYPFRLNDIISGAGTTATGIVLLF